MTGIVIVLVLATIVGFCLTYDDFIKPFRYHRKLLREVKSGKLMSGPGTVQSMLVRHLPNREWQRVVAPEAAYYNGSSISFGKPTTEKLKDMIFLPEECPPNLDMVIFEHDNNTHEVVVSQCGFTGFITKQQYIWVILGGSLDTDTHQTQT